MLAYGSEKETLPNEIERDRTTGFPLLSEADGILQLILAYLELPYSVTEHGCGKKASLILDYLLKLRIPAYGLARGMALEPDLSPTALIETDYRNRPQALVAENPLNSLCDLKDERLRRMLKESAADVEEKDGFIRTGPYILRHDPMVQFAQARSHIYPILWFWDPDKNRAIRMVIDPSLHRQRLFPPEEVRTLLHSPECLLLQAPLLGRFLLDPPSITSEQNEKINSILSKKALSSGDLEQLSYEDHAWLIREFTGAEPGSLGDPETWSYANNLQGWDRDQDQAQYNHTGKGESLRILRKQLIEARQEKSGDAPAVRGRLRDQVDDAQILSIAADDARWSARALAPLSDVTMTVVYFNALMELAGEIKESKSVLRLLEDAQTVHRFRGLGVRLRRRVDWLAECSLDEEGRIDARALNDRFFKASQETIRQMNAARLAVCVDSVGNLHGLLIKAEDRDRLRQGDFSLLQQAIQHGSHIDSVNNAGRFDGRLGVAGGIEALHTITDLTEYFNCPALPEGNVYSHVSAFLGEEMTFTGEGVSMPGSAAVAGRAEPERIYKMTNADGDVYKDRLLEFLRFLRDLQKDGHIELINDLQCDDQELLDRCPHPHLFFTSHTYERHIEQGPELDRHQVPLALVDRIMGIHQEDFFFSGENSEAAALEFDLRLRELARQQDHDGVRITVGIIEAGSEFVCHEDAPLAMRWTLEGELNHAGATAIIDRKDPGVAAGRMARKFCDLLDRMDGEFRPLVGNVRLDPGSNRNVIPGAAHFTLAVQGQLTEEQCDQIARQLQGFAISELTHAVSAGGEGIRLSRMDRMSYANVHGSARLTIDLRAGDREVSGRFRESMNDIIKAVAQEYNATIKNEIQQQLMPYSLERSGQVLIMERSYGGSHNPNEAELQADLTRGCLYQFGLLEEVLRWKDLPKDFNFFEFAEERMPTSWKQALARFTSGALHDTCNIAAAAGSRES